MVYSDQRAGRECDNSHILIPNKLIFRNRKLCNQSMRWRRKWRPHTQSCFSDGELEVLTAVEVCKVSMTMTTAQLQLQYVGTEDCQVTLEN